MELKQRTKRTIAEYEQTEAIARAEQAAEIQEVNRKTRLERQSQIEKAAQQRELADLRAFVVVSGNVRFTPKSGHWDSVVECPLCAKSGHQRATRLLPSRKFKRDHVFAIRDGCHREPNPPLANQSHEGEGEPKVPGDGHGKELDPCRHHLACDRLVCARRWRRSADPT